LTIKPAHGILLMFRRAGGAYPADQTAIPQAEGERPYGQPGLMPSGNFVALLMERELNL
jgi:hypothetical protein